MGALAVTPGVIATIVVIAVIAVGMLLLYFVCRSDDPVKDHTCVAMLYPRSRSELRQLKVPLDPGEPTDIHVNAAYEHDEHATEPEHHAAGQHAVMVHMRTESADGGECSITLHAVETESQSRSGESSSPDPGNESQLIQAADKTCLQVSQ
ncbi:predicted protein [Nematostella vectensis]|uniref:Uncharacterized protein n=1 Tax=Nematostella vectensis TaxID=45351 RepID=A7SCX3_NEMVE|nr:predicted protein [Nematostella vectensis]|eukprot:XP_001630542.1 predicted protein [Nematostella vectensis]